MSTIITPYGGAGGGGAIVPMFLGYWYPFSLNSGSSVTSNTWYDGDGWPSDYQASSKARNFVTECIDRRNCTNPNAYNSDYVTNFCKLSVKSIYGGYLRISFARTIHKLFSVIRQINQFGITLELDYDDGALAYTTLEPIRIGTKYTPNTTEPSQSNGNAQHLQYFIDKIAMPYYYDGTYDIETETKYGDYKYNADSVKRRKMWDALWRYAIYPPEPPQSSSTSTDKNYYRNCYYIIPFQSGFSFEFDYSTVSDGTYAPYISFGSDDLSDSYDTNELAFEVEVFINGLVD